MKLLGLLFGLLAVTLFFTGACVGVGAGLGWVAEWMVGTSHYGDWYRYGGAVGFVYGAVQSLRATLQILAEKADP